MHLSALRIHPVKSCAGIVLDAAEVQPRGLAHDRRWMVVGPDGQFLTGRQLPRLVLIRPRIEADRLVLAAPDMPDLPVAAPGGGAERLSVQVWKDTIDAAGTDPTADAWLSAFLQQPARLVFMDARARRATPRGRVGDEVSFADAAPLLAISLAALDALNARLDRPVAMANLRPNLVIAGCAAHAEDGWQRLRIGAVEFEAGQRCGRCAFITVDPERGERDPKGEPLATLARYRREGNSVLFGRYLLPRSEGVLRVGDALSLLD